ncbi:MAG TPA: Xaa-Pro peptidase family protein [Rhizomicrobium sp.]|jgi:Xaa-Pro dipeptidase|nr:Xaa-Pro peptidase family protein [Rhizomicrobium sp.]HWA23014.1 Xaa-Pro peptidase family protein [Caulobacterales bacterium]
MRKPPPPIGKDERRRRIANLCVEMENANIGAVLVGPTASLRYFTGVNWHPSERFTGALIYSDGRVEYVTPAFERDKVAQVIGVDGDIFTWQEEESPYRLIASRLGNTARMAVDESVALFTWLGLNGAIDPARLSGGGALINRLRRRKSAAELALMQYAKDITLEVQRRVWKALTPGIRASEAEAFIDREHRALGGSGNIFCIVSFGEDTALPHGGETDRALKEGDAVLIDTGTSIDGYNSDITRSYVFGEPGAEYRRVWEAEKRAQAAAFEAARMEAPCESVDAAARASMGKEGFGPDYRLPGLPHRTGHGIGLEVHEAPNLVRGDRTPLEAGMCFSNEPMIVVPGKFGVRLEDHFYMDEMGARWFTHPSPSLDEPFAGVPNWDAA